MKHFMKVLRNAVVLGVGYLLSLWASKDAFLYADWKAVAIFVGMYIVAECTNYYRITNKKGTKNVSTLIL